MQQSRRHHDAGFKKNAVALTNSAEKAAVCWPHSLQ